MHSKINKYEIITTYVIGRFRLSKNRTKMNVHYVYIVHQMNKVSHQFTVCLGYIHFKGY